MSDLENEGQAEPDGAHHRNDVIGVQISKYKKQTIHFLLYIHVPKEC